MKYKIGQQVQVQGDNKSVYEVVGIFFEEQSFEGESVKECLYTLKNCKSPECLYDIDESYIIVYNEPENTKPKGQDAKDKIKQQMIDEILDGYNDLMLLHSLFGDVTYKQKANKKLSQLKKLKLTSATPDSH